MMSKAKCCKSYRKKGKACKTCPVLAEIRRHREDIGRKDVDTFLRTFRPETIETEEEYMCVFS